MDYNNDKNMWDWLGDYCQEDLSNSIWSNLNCENEDEHSYMVDDEVTPVKACGDLTYHVTDNENNMNKVQEQCRETYSQVKRRRMLQFDTDVLDVLPNCNEDISSTFIKSKHREDSIEDAISDMSQWVSGFADDTSASGSGYDGLESSEDWLADCFNDTDMHFSPDDMNPSGISDVQADVIELHNTQPECKANTVQQQQQQQQQQQPARPRRNIIFKGKKSLMKAPTKVASSVVYPFAFVKPCGMQGAVTLKDINQRILTPPLKSTQNKEDAAPQYPTSAFSGKPVVGKTKIRTEGGKGSITIMRTKG